MDKIDDLFLMRPAISTYVVGFIFIGILEILSILVLFKNNLNWEPFVIVSLGAIFLFYFIYSNRIKIYKGKCQVSKPFFNRITFSLDKIKNVKFSSAFRGHKSILHSPYSIEIELSPEVNLKNIAINLKLFRLNDIEKFFSLCKIDLENKRDKNT